MTGVTGPGPWPGAELLPQQLSIFDDLGQVPFGVQALPFWASLEGSAPYADTLGRTLSILEQLPLEVGPHGWKLADRPGMDEQRLARALDHDVEALTFAAAGYSGPLTLSVVGPWTLAATLYLARGDRVLTDRGAVRELTDSLAAGLVDMMGRLRSALPGIELTVQIDERHIGQIAAGVLPTFSGYSRIHAVPGPELAAQSQVLYQAITAAGAKPVVRVGEAWVGIAPSVVAGAAGISLDFTAQSSWNERAWDHIARAVEKGVEFWAGLPAPEVSQCSGPNLRQLADAIVIPWKRIGLESSRLAHVTVAPSLAAVRPLASSPDSARAVLSTAVRVAEYLAEKAED